MYSFGSFKHNTYFLGKVLWVLKINTNLLKNIGVGLFVPPPNFVPSLFIFVVL
jgi:hypothetical protein